MNKTRTLAATLMLLAMATLTAVTVTPTAAAHTCEARLPDECGPCTPPGPHSHYIYVTESTKVFWCGSVALPMPCSVLAELGVSSDDCDET